MRAECVRIISILTIFNAAYGQIYYSKILQSDPRLSEDGRLDFNGLAQKYGHPADKYDVVTEDGYILSLFHLPGVKARPLLIVHGNTVDPDIWMIRGNTSVGIAMAEKGYDVWIVSLRGTIYSRGNVKTNADTDPKEYFDFSFHEQGIYDVASCIDFILDKTGQNQLLVIGYSVGTTNVFVLTSEKPEYNDKIKAFIALAPIVYLQNQRGVTKLGTPFQQIVSTFLTITGTYETEGRDQLGTYLLQSFCLEDDAYDLCVKGLVFGLFGPDKANFEPNFTSTFFGHYPAGSNKKMYEHVTQITNSAIFRQYDYGLFGNLNKYASITPPKYNLGGVTTNVALFVAEADYLSTVIDVQRLSEELPNVVHHEVLAYKDFNHFDFFGARNITEILYPSLMKVVEKYI